MSQEQANAARQNLRRRAESALDDNTLDLDDFSPQQLKALVQELRIHQIELELQNEELRHAQLEREMALERYDALFNFSPVAYVLLDTDGAVVHSNQTTDRLLKRPASDLTGQRFSRFVLAADQDRFHFFLQALGGSDETQQMKLNLVQPDGAHRYVLLEGRRDFGALATGQNQQQQAEYHLSLSDITTVTEIEQAYQTLVENSLQGQAIIQEGQFVFVNTALTNIFGYSRDEILAWSTADIAALLHPDDRIPVLENISGGLLKPHLETGFTHKSGETRWVESYAVPITYRGRPAIQISFLDISNRKQTERDRTQLLTQFQHQRGQLKALTAKLAEVQEAERKTLARELHDQVGQQLTSLNLNLTTLRTHLLTANATPPPATLSLVDHSLALVEETIDRIQDVLANLRPPVLDDYGLLAALQWYAAELAPQVDFTIHVRGQEPNPRLAAQVELALFRVTQETLVNVIKHSRATRVTIKLETNHWVQLSISDDGVGFAVEGQQKSAKRAGLGLLTITERIEAVGGHCQIESQPGVGTRIIAEVPR